jgi:hypothetical protein
LSFPQILVFFLLLLLLDVVPADINQDECNFVCVGWGITKQRWAAIQLMMYKLRIQSRVLLLIGNAIMLRISKPFCSELIGCRKRLASLTHVQEEDERVELL